MTEKEINIKFHEYSSLDELNKEDRELADAAIDAMKGSYAPYSHFNVGAALRLSNGTIVQGANQENAAFPSGLCAERTAMFHAGATYPDKAMVSLAIAGGVMGRLAKAPATPCGAGRKTERSPAEERRRATPGRRHAGRKRIRGYRLHGRRNRGFHRLLV